MVAFFTFGGTDWSPHIDKQNYDVNQKTEYTQWQDGNRRYHREDLRTRITGKFNIGFKKQTDYDAWMAAMENRVQGYYTATLHVNNLDDVVETDVFLTAPLIVKRDEINGRFWAYGTVTVEEC